jgi:hypothetical protein
MPKPHLLILLLIISLLAFPSSTSTLNHDTEITLAKAFESSGATIKESSAFGFGDLGDYQLTIEELEVLALKKLTFLGGQFQNIQNTHEDNLEYLSKHEINNPLLRKIEEEGYREIYLISKIDDQYVVRIVVQSMDIDVEGRNEHQNYMRVQINDEGSFQDIKLISNLVRAAIDLPIESGFGAHVIGYYDELLSSGRQKEIIKKALKVLDCKDIDITSTSYDVSVTAYSPYLGEGLRFGNSTINVQAIIRNNYFTNQTQLLIATPMITTEF